MLSDKPTFGPGGNGDWFYRDGGKSTVQAPAWLEKIGLDAYEYEAGRGVVAGEESLRAVGEAAAAHGIRMSLHAPYFISLSGAVEEKRLASIDYIRKSLWAAELLGADTIVIHSGSAGKMSRAEAMRLSCDTLARVMQAVGDTSIRLGIETMGKVNQLGTLDEVIEQCRVDPHYHPVVDFGHMNARERGGLFPDCDSYRRVFSTVAERLGDAYARHLHCHFSRIAYTDGGEKRHLTFADTVYGPEFEPLAEALAKAKAEGRSSVYVRAWLPIPAACLSQSEIELLDLTEPPARIADENAPQRTVYWEADLAENRRFGVQYRYRETAAYTDPLDFTPDAEQPTFDTGEEAPHIVFTPYLKALAHQLTDGITDPAEFMITLP